MDELDDHGELDMPVALVTQRAGGEQNQQRPQPLAAAADDVLGNLIHEDDIGREARANGAIDGREIVVDERPNRREVHKHRGGRGGKHGRRHRQLREMLRTEYSLEGSAGCGIEGARRRPDTRLR